MKASFFKRVGAYLVDLLIVATIVAIVTIGFKGNNDINKKYNELLTSYSKSEITINEYTNEIYKLEYNNQKNNIYYNVTTVVIYIGYYIVFATLNKGKTIGKLLFRIKVVDNNDNPPKIGNMIIRGLCIYNILSLIYCIISVNIFNETLFRKGYMIISYLESIIIIVSFFMITYKKDGKGIHDLVARTKVVNEVKK